MQPRTAATNGTPGLDTSALGLRDETSDDRFELLDRHGFQQMGVETGIDGKLAILGEAVTRERDECTRTAAASQTTRERVAVHVRKVDGEEAEVEGTLRGERDRGRGVECDVHGVAEQLEQELQALRRVGVSVDHQDAGGGRARR